MAYPDKINALVDIAGTSTLSAVGHAARHNDLNDAFDELAVVLTVPAANTLALAPGGTEKLRVDSAGLITGTGTSLGAWTAYTPTLGGTGWAIGDGTLAFGYAQIGKIVHVRGVLTWGSTSTYGSSTLTLTLPVTAGGSSTNRATASTMYYDTSAGKYFQGSAFVSSTTASFFGSDGGANMQMDGLISTRPFTWASGDSIRFGITYESA
jgi:hypothetical protein